MALQRKNIFTVDDTLDAQMSHLVDMVMAQ